MRLPLVSGFVLAVVLAVACASPALAQQDPPPDPALPTPGAPAKREAEVVLTGVFLIDLWRLDVERGLFDADFYCWFKWKGERFNPSGIEFMNAERIWQFREQEKVVMGDQTYVTFRVSGTFKGYFNLQSYPFDTQSLEIQIEDQVLELQDLVFVPDSKMFDGTPRDMDLSARERQLNIPGWRVIEVKQTHDTHTYHTDWGAPIPTGKASRYSRYAFALKVKRLVYPYLLKFLLPLVVIVLISFLVFFIEADQFGVQVLIGLVAMMAALVFHSMQSKQLADVGYLVLVDKFFILSYTVIFLTLVQTVGTHALHRRGAVERAAALDGLCRFLFPLLYLTGVAALVVPNL